MILQHKWYYIKATWKKNMAGKNLNKLCSIWPLLSCSVPELQGDGGGAQSYSFHLEIYTWNQNSSYFTDISTEL